ncbi:hypothetical protein SAMN04488066_10563 [Halorubrum aquaticum]|uniref:Uncharacterized protein n=1 Tax=Halorubrum aquaticum TaxID=387340 RepID=A0A1I3AC55_9EURY|nr:hypothetical protein [Halorubrum aquaticum]SFH47664.1 hypothetical protein SAMN04488066_10563 [Halorubrum aquaticum]
MTDEDDDGAIAGGAGDDTDDVAAGADGDETRLSRRWRALDRGWQALCLGLAIVAAHLVIYPV